MADLPDSSEAMKARIEAIMAENEAKAAATASGEEAMKDTVPATASPELEIKVTEPIVEEPKELTEAQKLRAKMDEVIKEYGQASNIPINHQYWGWKNQLISLRK